MAGEPIIAVCTFRVKQGSEQRFEELLKGHWPTLRRLGLATDRPTQLFRGEEKEGGPVYVEVFEWASAEHSSRAHETPEVMAIWEPMGQLVEARGTRPPMDFIHVTDLEA